MEENKTVRWDEIKRKCFWQQKKAKAADCAKRAWKWCLENPIPALTAAGGAYKLIRTGCKAYSTHREDVRRDTDFYDPRKGTHAHSRRKPTRAEQVKISERYDNGESYVQILNDMGLLK